MCGDFNGFLIIKKIKREALTVLCSVVRLEYSRSWEKHLNIAPVSPHTSFIL